MRDNISPEEKLLRLIRAEKKTKPSPNLWDKYQGGNLDKEVTADIPHLKPAIKKPRFSFIRPYLTAGNIQRLIPVFLIASIVYLLISFIYPFVGLNKIELPKTPLDKMKELELKLKKESKPLEFYLQGIRQREIFGNPVGSSQETVIPAGATEADLIKDISLVGIISGLTPQAIIEDKKAQKTYYVTKGQFIGEMQVEDILEGKIILNFKGKRFELYI